MNSKRIPKELTREEFENFRLIDDGFFQQCFGSDIEATEQLISIILGLPGLKILSVSAEKTIPNREKRRAILDLHAISPEGEQFDVEVQTSFEPNLPQRSRFYSSLITSRSLEKGQNYSALRPSYVIFICEKDPIKEGRAIYHYKMIDLTQRDNPLHLNDGTNIVFLNLEYRANDPIGKLNSDLISRHDSENPIFRNLMKYNKEGPRGADNMLAISKEYYEAGFADGKEEGIKQGREEKLLFVRKLLESKKLSDEEIAEMLGVGLSEVEEIKRL